MLVTLGVKVKECYWWLFGGSATPSVHDCYPADDSYPRDDSYPCNGA